MHEVSNIASGEAYIRRSGWMALHLHTIHLLSTASDTYLLPDPYVPLDNMTSQSSEVSEICDSLQPGRILLLGLKGAGKSTILSKLNLGDVNVSTSTGMR